MRRDSRLSFSLHALLHMSEHEGSVTSEALGKNMDANPVVIRRTMAGLRNAGLVQSVKGHGGGWSIAKPLNDITLLDIYRALDEPILIQQHREVESPACFVEQTVGRTLEQAYQEAEELILSRLSKIRLAELRKSLHSQLHKHRKRH